jgi:hypothetical protein
MDENEKGYVTLLLLILIAFGFLLSGGLMALLQPAPASTGRYVLVNTTPFPTHQTLQLSTLNLIYSPPLVVGPCNVGSSYTGIQEPGILYASKPSSNETVTAGGQIKVWYTDEHAISLGKGTGTASGNGDGISPWTPSMTQGSPVLVGDMNAKDNGTYPYFPALFLTNITEDPTSTAGDAQNGGTGHPPAIIYGVWKPLNGADPTGYRADAMPAVADPFSSIPSQYLNNNTGSRGHEPGYKAEMIWNVNDLPVAAGQTYRAQFIVHDGDRDGDIGLGCTTIQMAQ